MLSCDIVTINDDVWVEFDNVNDEGNANKGDNDDEVEVDDEGGSDVDKTGGYWRRLTTGDDKDGGSGGWYDNEDVATAINSVKDVFLVSMV